MIAGTLALGIGARVIRLVLSDTMTYVGLGLVVIAAALLAASLPARRAPRVDPIAASRIE